jgi:hypothetical protein
MVPTVGSFFTPLRLTQAFKEYDACFHISRRKFIPPNFAELRHILNIAQVSARRAVAVIEQMALQRRREATHLQQQHMHSLTCLCPTGAHLAVLRGGMAVLQQQSSVG